MIMQTDAATAPAPIPFETVDLSLHVQDPELCTDLLARDGGRDRHDFAVDAMRIGALALKRAQGQVDADRVRSEGDRILENLQLVLTRHKESIEAQVNGALKEYFDPNSGRFNERVSRLIDRDGDLEQALRRVVGEEGSDLATTLSAYVGEGSPLLNMLDPGAAEGVVQTLETSVADALTAQRERVLLEFSLDNPEGALSRLVDELKRSNGDVVGQFSLDDPTSALSRLVRHIKDQQAEITRELSLDQEGSALHRIRREFTELITTHEQRNERFQRDVLQMLTGLSARREEAKRSTRHGDDFEDAVFDFLQDRSQRRGDVATRTGNTTGKIRNCKKGDAVIELGPDHAAAGAQIVAEAKANASYTLKSALAELEEAKKNRSASAGLFVFAPDAAPEGVEAFGRYGNDVVVTWDAEDPASDVVLHAGLELTRALAARTRLAQEDQEADLESLDASIREIEKQAKGLEEIHTWATTIGSNSEKILKRVRIMRKGLADQIQQLDATLVELRGALEGGAV